MNEFIFSNSVSTYIHFDIDNINWHIHINMDAVFPLAPIMCSTSIYNGYLANTGTWWRVVVWWWWGGGGE